MEDYESQSDEELAVIAVRQKDVFGVLYHRYKGKLFNFIHPRLIKDSMTAEDIVQESMCKAYYSLAKFDPSKKWKAWIYGIAIKTSYSELRKRQVKSLEEVWNLLSPEDPEKEAAKRELLEKLRAASVTLCGLQREVFELIYLLDMDEKRAAEALGKNIFMVKRAHLKAIEFLKVMGCG